MIDSMHHALAQRTSRGFAEQCGLTGDHVVVTLHRPSNVDDPARLLLLANALRAVAEVRPVLFHINPRTRQRLSAMNLNLGQVRLFDPIGYFEMIDLERSANAAITDSGGLQEKTTALGVPCFTVRDDTERPVSITHGTNKLVRDIASLPTLIRSAAPPVPARIPEGWDGHAAARVVDAVFSR